LVTLDTSSLEDVIGLATIEVNTATANKDQADKDYDVAEIAVKEYEKGIFEKDLQTLKANVEIANENLSSAKNSLEHSERMFRKGYISNLQLEAQKFAVRRADLELASANTAQMVLEKFTKDKMLTELRSKVQTAKSKKDSQETDFALKKAKLKRLQDQLANCVIKAPQDGVVIYANDNQRFGQQTGTIEQGANVAEGKDILRLPDMARMRAKLMVNETKVGGLRPELPVVIRIQGDRYHGHISSIASQFEQKGWQTAEVREYAVLVRIEQLISDGNLAEFSLTDKDDKSVDARQFDKNHDRLIKRDEVPEELWTSFDQVDVNRDGQLDPRDQLKPGMTADATITVETLSDVMKIPVTAVVSKGNERYCWIRKGNSSERRAIVLGRTDDSHYQVLDGIGEGDEVIKNPRTGIDDARKLEQEARTEEAAQRANGHTNGSSATPEKSGAVPPGAKAPPAAKGPPGPGGPGPNGPGLAGPGASGPGAGPKTGAKKRGFDWKAMDKNHDGKVSKEEASEETQPFFDRIDTNGDGFIDAQEQAEMRKRMSGAGGPGQGPPQ
jgi:HlyD family secretion protein